MAEENGKNGNPADGTGGNGTGASGNGSTNGGGGMPPFKGTLTPQQIKDVATFIAQYSGTRKTCAECPSRISVGTKITPPPTPNSADNVPARTPRATAANWWLTAPASPR